MNRTVYDDDHDIWRESVRRFYEREVVPQYQEWVRDCIVPRDMFKRAAELGAFDAVPAEYGGTGSRDFRYNAIFMEEAARAGVAPFALGIGLQSDVCMPYFRDLCNDAQKARWLPGIASGELITAIAMTEPGTGSDLSSIKTSAIRVGDEFVVNGAKTFITNGINADVVIVVVRTGEHRHKGLSLLVVERGMEGFERGRKLDKVGLHVQDTAELFFRDVRVPVENLLGKEGEGFLNLARNLAQERIAIAVASISQTSAAFETTVAYVREREVFGKKVGQLQNTRFRLAEIATELDIGQLFVDRCVLELNSGTLSPVDAAKAKWWTTELMSRTVDACVQLHGGYGYMLEYPIARAFIDSRVARIYGGTTEIMKEIIARSLELD